MHRHELIIFTFTTLTLTAVGAHAEIAAYTSDSSQMGTITEYADFNALVDGQSLLHYQEDGLEISANRTYYSWDVPGLDGSGLFYPNTGALEQVQISRVDGTDFIDLDMQISTGWSPNAIGPAYIWVRVFDNGGLVSQFDIDAFSGQYLGITGGGFDQIMIGAYASASTRDAHNPNARNAIAIDNLRAGTVVPAPGALALLGAMGMLTTTRRRRG